MFCHGCGVEYRSESFRCPECGENLREHPPPLRQDDASLVAVYHTADPPRLAVVKSALDSAGIPCVVQGEGAVRLFPLGPFGAGVTKRVLGAIILVPASRAEEAREFLESFEVGSETPPDDPDE